ncbi:hypothetical protein KIN20_004825 [Parelaphostrongylus tenuis]|uniref:Secreted protein n=1 Tax=Parelaphostrongylus tenuis TaxID=148309 RepID=A0AAD5MHJ8_PARTN|nr:hypothetical protein KIN20_004825 [Parelaphostrongylus tenuis]
MMWQGVVNRAIRALASRPFWIALLLSNCHGRWKLSFATSPCSKQVANMNEECAREKRAEIMVEFCTTSKD